MSIFTEFQSRPKKNTFHHSTDTQQQTSAERSDVIAPPTHLSLVCSTSFSIAWWLWWLWTIYDEQQMFNKTICLAKSHQTQWKTGVWRLGVRWQPECNEECNVERGGAWVKSVCVLSGGILTVILLYVDGSYGPTGLLIAGHWRAKDGSILP